MTTSYWKADVMLTALGAGRHVLLEDVPGTGKTLLIKTKAAVSDAEFSRIQFTPDVLPGDVTGIRFFNMKTRVRTSEWARHEKRIIEAMPRGGGALLVQGSSGETGTVFSSRPAFRPARQRRTIVTMNIQRDAVQFPYKS